MSIKKFDYEGKPITFEFQDGNNMINATEMAKPFNKRVNDFIRLKGTKDIFYYLNSVTQIPVTEKKSSV